MNDRGLSQQVLHRPHLVLADSGRPDHVFGTLGSNVAKGLEHRLRLEHALGAAVLVRIEAPPLLELRMPRRPVDRLRVLERLQLASQVRERELERADDGDLRVTDLPDLGGVDVEVDHFRPGANAETLPVTRSSKRTPSAMIRSHLFSAQFAYFDPCMPGAP